MVATKHHRTIAKIVLCFWIGCLWSEVVVVVLASREQPRSLRLDNDEQTKRTTTSSFSGAAAAATTTTREEILPHACMPPHHHEYRFCDYSLPLSERIDDLISRLTLEEKPMLLTARYSPKGSIDRLGIPEYNYGSSCMHGVESRCSTQDNRCPTSFPNPNLLGATFNQTLWKSIGNSLGLELRSLWLQNVGEPNAQAQPHLGLDCWSPNINLQRDPRWGRNLESPSEDPYLLGSYGVSFVKGLQENPEVDPRYLQAVATLKHFAAHSLEGRFWNEDGKWKPPTRQGEGAPEGSNPPPKISRHNQDVHVSLYDLETTYLKAFETSIKEGKAAGVMCAFNKINGAPVSVSEDLLKRVLREEWGFDGYVTSDTGGLNDVRDHHGYTHDWETTVSLAISAGCDVESIPARGYKKNGDTRGDATGYDDGDNSDNGDNNDNNEDDEHEREPAGTNAHDEAWKNSGVNGLYIDFLPKAVRKGFLSESSLDEALKNALGIRFRLGLFDPVEDQPFWKIPPRIVQSPSHVRLSEEATAQGLVLLKNENALLPLAFRNNTNTKAPTSTLALIGPHIHDRTTTIGNYHGEICKDDPTNGCVASFFEGFSETVEAHSGGNTKLLVSKGCEVAGNDTTGFGDALEAASNAEAVIFLGGLDLNLEREDHDRPDIRLPEVQTQLLQRIAKVNPKIVLVLLHGGMVGLDDVLEHVEAIVSAGYPGRYASTVLPEALLGVRDRGWGKSPVTWYKNSFVDEFNVLDYDMGRPPGRTYRYYRGEPNFRFGVGLNPLTTFGLKEMAIIPWNCPDQNLEGDSPGILFCSKLHLSGTVSNTGHRAADEVVMAYFVPLDIPQSEPASKLREQLFGFERIHLQPGQSREVSFVVQANKTLKLATSLGKPVTFPGRYLLRISNGMEFSELTLTVGEDGLFRMDSQTVRVGQIA